MNPAFNWAPSMYKTFHWVPAGNINMNTARLVMNRNIVTRQVSLKPLTQAETEKVKVTKRELLKIKNGRQALLNRRYSSSSGLFLSSEAEGHHSLSLCRDRSETSNLHKRPDTRRVQRHKKTEGCWVGGREDNGERERERPKWRGPKRDISAKSREWIWPRGVSRETRTKFQE